VSGTPDQIAKWMLTELNSVGVLYQDEAAHRISQDFGDDATYENENGNLAIAKPILTAFNKLTGKDVVWVRSERFWRRREPEDLPGRQQ
jgi:hypothetical protein